MIKQHEDDVVSVIYNFRDRMRKVQNVISNDLVKMTGEYPVFVSFAADELASLARLQRETEVVLSVLEVREPGYTKRVLERVGRWEALSDSEKNRINSSEDVR